MATGRLDTPVWPSSIRTPSGIRPIVNVLRSQAVQGKPVDGKLLVEALDAIQNISDTIITVLRRKPEEEYGSLDPDWIGDGLTLGDGKIDVNPGDGIEIEDGEIKAKTGAEFEFIDGSIVIKDVDFGKAKAGTFDRTDFELAAGAFRVKGVDLLKAINFSTAEFEKAGGVFLVKGLAAEKLKTGILEVGGAPVGGSRVSLARFYTTDWTPQLYAWIGDDSAGSGYVGAWFKRMLIGGDGPATAKIVADSNGNVAISGATFTLVKEGITTQIANLAGGYYGTVGIRLSDSAGQALELYKNQLYISGPNGGLPICYLQNNHFEMSSSTGGVMLNQGALYLGSGVAPAKVVGNRQPAINNFTVSIPTSGSNVADACEGDLYNILFELKDKVESLINRMRTHGLIAT